MDSLRRDFMKLAGAGLAGTAIAASRTAPAQAASPSPASACVDVQKFGATGDGKTIDSPAIKEEEAKYPDPRMFGDMPTQGFFVRHVKNLEMSDIHLIAASQDLRPGFKFQDIDGLSLFRIRAEPGSNAAKVILDDVRQCDIARFQGLPDITLASVDHKELG